MLDKYGTELYVGDRVRVDVYGPGPADLSKCDHGKFEGHVVVTGIECEVKIGTELDLWWEDIDSGTPLDGSVLISNEADIEFMSRTLSTLKASLPDTGEREQFQGGAMREADPDKPAVEGISPHALLRLGSLLTKGGQKYGDFRNWEKGMPFTRCIGGIIRHTALYMLRDDREDHPAAIMWNAMALCHYEAYEKQVELWDDRPYWPDMLEDEMNRKATEVARTLGVKG